MWRGVDYHYYYILLLLQSIIISSSITSSISSSGSKSSRRRPTESHKVGQTATTPVSKLHTTPPSLGTNPPLTRQMRSIRVLVDGYYWELDRYDTMNLYFKTSTIVIVIVILLLLLTARCMSTPRLPMDMGRGDGKRMQRLQLRCQLPITPPHTG